MEASEDVPLLFMLLRLDMPVVHEVLSRDDLPASKAAPNRCGLAAYAITAQGNWRFQ